MKSSETAICVHSPDLETSLTFQFSYPALSSAINCKTHPSYLVFSESYVLIPDHPVQAGYNEEEGKQSEGKLVITETGRDSGKEEVRKQE